MNYEEAMQNCIFRFLSGSQAYQTSMPESDFDYRGVFIAPLQCAFELFQTSFVGNESIRGYINNAIAKIDGMEYKGAKDTLKNFLKVDNGDLNFSVGTVKKPGEDEELQELRKFLKLASECNPNLIELLYIEDDDTTKDGVKLITHITPIWRKIREQRHMFLSKKARFTFSGYAIAQLRRIQSHRKYILNPVPKPDRASFGLPIDSKIRAEHRKAILSIPDKWLSPDSKEEVKKEQRYHQQLRDYQAYKKWGRERNEKRKALESKCGYDAKHASHLLRLVRMCEEILRDGTVNVCRPDADELLNIRMGNVPYDEIMKLTDNMDDRLDVLYKSSNLRDKPDHKGIANLYKDICKEVYGVKI